MAMEAGGPPHSPQIVGIAFVEKYYRILFHSPEHVYKFYEDFSTLSRPGPDGDMLSVTTIQGINDKILSLETKNFKMEILTADAQLSHNEGIIILVTGCLTEKDYSRKFTQSFFLAPQDNGYFVLNDVFRYVDENKCPRVETVSANGDCVQAPASPLFMNPEPTHVPEQPIPNNALPVEEPIKNRKEVNNQLNIEVGSVAAKEVVGRAQLDSRQNGSSLVNKSTPSNVQVDAPKKSYASIVITAPVHIPASSVQAQPENSEHKLRASQAPEASARSANSALNSNSYHSNVESYCIHIRNLPLSARAEHVERIFKKYGTIKQGGVQIRSYQRDGSCFAFVEFETLSDMEKAIRASPLKIDGGREVTVEEKKTSVRGGNGSGRRPPRRDELRNDNFRGRGNFVGGRGNRQKGGSHGSPRTRHIEVDEEGFQKVSPNADRRIAR